VSETPSFPLTAQQIEHAVFSPETQQRMANTLNLEKEEPTINPEFWGVPEANHDVAPAPVAIETPEQKMVEQMNRLTDAEAVTYIRQLTPHVKYQRDLALAA